MTSNHLTNEKSMEMNSYAAAKKAVEDFFKIYETTKICLPYQDVLSYVEEHSAIALAYQVHRATVKALYTATEQKP